MSNIKNVIKKVFNQKKEESWLFGAKKEGKDNEWGNPIASYTITFESNESQLESIYYWLLDFIEDGGWETKKIVDNFMSSPGSGHFAEMGQRLTRLQEEGMKILGALNQVIKSVLNLIYDLKEFEIRLKIYDDAKSEDKKIRESGILGLKQIWLDNVDVKRGRGSIHGMSQEMGFTTIREAFMIANSIDDLKKMNRKFEKEWEIGEGIINDQVMRILIPRISEFLKWGDYSEKELRKRMSIEKNYLKSQVETIKLYSQWLKPYLKSAEQLRQKGFDNNSALVNAFSTSMFELELFAKNPKGEEVPNKFGDYNLKRKYYPCIVINMGYRGHVSQKVTQRGDYGFAVGGRIDITFDAYAINSEELKFIEEELVKEDVEESMQFSSDMAQEALKELKEDLDYFLKNEDEKKKDDEKMIKKKKSEEIDPFKAIFNLFRGKTKKEKSKEPEKIEDLKKDNFIEQEVRVAAANTAADFLYAVYDVYKKSHGMASTPEPLENQNEDLTKEPKAKFKDIFRGREGNW